MTTLPDLLRLLAVPVFAWVAYRDVRTRRVPSRTWYPLVALGLVALVGEAIAASSGAFVWRRFLLSVGVSLGILVPLGYGFHRFGGFGGADAKAFMVIALLFPTYPVYRLGPLVLPLSVPAVGVFSLTIVTDAVLLGAAYPLALALSNAAAGRVAPAMFVGRPIPWSRVERAHGKLLESTGGFTRHGLDLDALRMYLRWRGITLSALRADAASLRDPATLPDEPNPPTDGAVDALADGGRPEEALDGDGDPPGDVSGVGRHDDPWGAAAFLDDVGPAYGATPESLRDALDLLVSRDEVWVSPGIPFLVLVFLGLLVALTYGDVLFAVLRATGVV